MSVNITIQRRRIDGVDWLHAKIMAGDKICDYGVIEEMGLEYLLTGLEPRVRKYLYPEKDDPGSTVTKSQGL
jgi:hypothetical protein